MKHPKSCRGCRALWQAQHRYYCDLGYKLETFIECRGKGLEITIAKPKNGKRPKPLTIVELINANKAYWNHTEESEVSHDTKTVS